MRYYGGEVAAPVFREVMKDLQRLPNGPFTSGALTVAAAPPAPAQVVVPDLNLLPPRLAIRKLVDFDLRGIPKGDGPRVLAQEPAAGTAVERGASVALWLSPPPDSTADLAPDLIGLPVREALRRLTLRQVVAHIDGQGIVVRQTPGPGEPLPAKRAMVLRCESYALGATQPPSTAQPTVAAATRNGP